MSILKRTPTGVDSIDKALGSGIPFESVSLVYGEAETGKTTLAIQCAVECACQGYKTLFVDCDGTFSAERLSQIAGKKFEEIAKLIMLMKPIDFREQTAVVDDLAEYVAKNFGLVVVDTITSLYRLRVAESPDRTFELNRELNRQVAFLAQVAKMQKLAVLLTSQVRTAFNDVNVHIEPVATRVLKFWADTIINMKLTENSSLVRAVLEKSSKEPQSATWLLKITETGLKEHTAR